MARRKQIDSRGTSDKKHPEIEPNSKTKKTVKPENLAYREWKKYCEKIPKDTGSSKSDYGDR